MQVRAHAVEVLQRTDDEELLYYLLQLVQALRYESSHDSRLARFIVGRAARNPVIGVYLHWYLYPEWEDPLFGPRAAHVHKAFQAAAQVGVPVSQPSPQQLPSRLARACCFRCKSPPQLLICILLQPAAPRGAALRTTFLRGICILVCISHSGVLPDACQQSMQGQPSQPATAWWGCFAVHFLED